MRPAICALMFLGCVLAAGATAAPAPIKVLSSHPEYVSGGDALVAVTGGGPITLNGADVTDAFKPGDNGARIGLIEGLKLGKNIVAAGGAKLILTNHPISGPVFSGPQEMPFMCMTDKFNLPASKETLGPALDANCTIRTRIDFVYRTNAGQFKPLPTGAAPDDLVQTTINTGKTVPYIVRVETGSINRAIYQISILATPDQSPSPTGDPLPNWNRKLVYTYGGGCPGGWYNQGATLGNQPAVRANNTQEDLMLRQGFAVASSTLNVFGNNCNMVLAGESSAMVKEHFIKTYGNPIFTIGWGCSGGSEQLSPMGDEYPGLVQGIIEGCSFPDGISGTLLSGTSGDLMSHYFKNTKLTSWTDAEKTAATGYPRWQQSDRVVPAAQRIKASNGVCSINASSAGQALHDFPLVPKDQQFDPATNPKGIRCDVYDHNVNILGRDPATGYARRPWDNVGWEYGLAALKSGAISAREFLDLNRDIGGYDNNGDYSPARTEADPIALKAAYESDSVTWGGLGLKSTPFIDFRGWDEAVTNTRETHSRFQTFSMRERLQHANGSAVNHVILLDTTLAAPGEPPGDRTFPDTHIGLGGSLAQMNTWLDNLHAGPDVRPSLAAIAKAKPADLSDACYTDHHTRKIAEPASLYGDNECNRLYPAASAPQLVAGEPVSNDVLKCRLKPITAADHGGKLGKDDLAELKTIFPKGVCDWSKPGVGQVRPKGAWLSYGG